MKVITPTLKGFRCIHVASWENRLVLSLKELRMSQRLSHHICLSCRRNARHVAKKDAAKPPLYRLSTQRRISTSRSSQYADVSESQRVNESEPLADTSLHSSDDPSPQSHDEDNVLPLEVTLHQARLYSPLDELRDRLLGGFRAHQRFEHLRSPELELKLASPIQLGRISPEAATDHRIYRPHLLLENSEEFKARVSTQLKQKDMRRLMKEQFERCRTPRDILQIVAVAIQRRETAVQVTHLHFPILAALYRVRDSATDPEILAALNVIVNRFRKERLPIAHEFIIVGLRFAARSRSLPAMKRYLKDAKEMGMHISGRAFRSIVAKFSIGRHGLGEIRNGRWKKEQLLQVLLGFEGMDPAEAYHLGAFLRRDDWAYFHGWVAVLARCKAIDQLWSEWKWWRDSEERASNKQLVRSPQGFTVKTRGDAWFIEQLCYAGEYERAWQILYETKTPTRLLSWVAKDWLMDHPEYARAWDEPIKQLLMEKYENELKKIEKAMGVKWVSEGNEGFHISCAEGEDAELIMEKLAESRPHIPHGYPEE